MITTPPNVSHEHHARLASHVDRLPAVGDLIGSGPTSELSAGLDETCDFLLGLLIPHMEAAEAVLYPELERLMQNRHSMTPMRREHEQIRALVVEIDGRRHRLAEHPLGTGDAVALRRVLFRLYAMLKVHLAEEQLYADLVEHALPADAEAALAAAMEHDGIGSF
jgi:iron-sulfur cluster repair protein YtfE (RIC family)